jgi:hypothetical protein
MTSPAGYAFEFPSDAAFQIIIQGAQMQAENGQSYMSVQIMVSNFNSAYPGFTAWIY